MAAHHRGAYLSRSITAAIALLGAGWCLYSILQYSGGISAAVGARILHLQAWAAFLFASIILTSTADSISREKREGTLGLLFLTHLRGHDVVLGKFLAHTIFWFSSALAALPVFMLPALLGGVRFTQSLNLFLSILNMLFFAASVGLFASSINHDRQKASSTGIFILLFFCVILPVAALFARKISLSPAHAELFELASPVHLHRLALSAPTGLGRVNFFASLAVNVLISAAFLFAACWFTPRTWQQRAHEPFLARLKFWRHSIKSRSPLGRRLLDRNAYEWLAARDNSAFVGGWAFFLGGVTLGGLFILLFTRHDTGGVRMAVSIPIAAILQHSLKLHIGGHACDRFVRDQSTGALELILSTPATIRQLVQGEFSALLRRFLLFVATALLLFATWRISWMGLDRIESLFTPDGAVASQFRFRALFLTLAFVLFLALDSIALVWTAIWCALRRLKNPRGAAAFWTLATPVLLLVLIMPIFIQSQTLRAWLDQAGFYSIAMAILVHLIAIDLALILYCRKKILTRGREAVTTPRIHTRDLPTLLSSLLRPFQRARA